MLSLQNYYDVRINFCVLGLRHNSNVMNLANALIQYSLVNNFCVLWLRHIFNVTNQVNALIYKLLLCTSSLLCLRTKTQIHCAESS